MNEDYISDIIAINKNQKNIINKNKTKVKLPTTISKITVIKYTSQNSIKINNKKYNYYKIIINNIKKYNFNEYKYNLSIINNLILHKKNHFISILQEKIIFYYNNEFLKKYYFKIDIIKKFPKFNLYYKNYFKFFLKPTFTDFYFCNIIRKNSNKLASVFYDKYNDNKIINKQNKINSNFKSIFTKAQKMEIQNIINNSITKNPENENKTLSTIIFSYESLNNSNNNNINASKEETSNSLISITNLINQSKIVRNKHKEKNEKNYFKNKINLFLNLEDKTTFTQKSTLLSSTRSKKYEAIKEKTNISNNNNFCDFINNNNKILKEKRNKNYKISTLKNKKENEHDTGFNFKYNMNKKPISLQQKSKSFKNFKDSKTKIGNEIIIIATKKNFINRNYTSENSNNNSKKKINELFLKSNSNSNINSCRNKTSLYSLTNNNYYSQTTQIKKNNKNYNYFSSNNNFFCKNTIKNEDIIINKNKKPNIFKDYNFSTTQITRINKKKLFSRNLITDLVYSQKRMSHWKNNNFTTSSNSMNKDQKIYINNNNYFSSNNFYNNSKLDKSNKGIKFPINIQKYINNDNEEKINKFRKNKVYNSSIENNKMKLNKLIKEIENLNLLKKIHKNNDEDKLKVYEYKNKK